MPTADADEQPGRRGGGDPARRTRAAPTRVPARRATAAGEADDARGAAEVLEAARNLLLLRAQALGREDRIGFGVGLRAQRRP